MSAPTSSAATPQNFTRFPSLPLELRLIIWKFALPGPRLLNMERNRRQIDDFYVPKALSGLGMLHTCIDARQVALKAFKVMPDPEKDLAHPLYFNAEADMLYFGTVECFIDFLTRNSRHVERGIRRVAAGMVHIHNREAIFKAISLYECVTRFEKVRECIIVALDNTVWEDPNGEILNTVWDPDCELMKTLVQLQTREERLHKEAIQKGLERTVARPVFTGIAESQFQRGEETLHRYS